MNNIDDEETESNEDRARGVDDNDEDMPSVSVACGPMYSGNRGATTMARKDDEVETVISLALDELLVFSFLHKRVSQTTKIRDMLCNGVTICNRETKFHAIGK